MILCLGPLNSGKTFLLKKLQSPGSVDNTAPYVPTVGTNVFKISHDNESYFVREMGGEMSSLWYSYFLHTDRLIYVIDVSNLCQLSGAGVLFYTILSNPLLKNCKFLLVLTKMDVSYRQMRNEALLMLQMGRLRNEIRQELIIIEASGITGKGRKEILDWMK